MELALSKICFGKTAEKLMAPDNMPCGGMLSGAFYAAPL
jgi:hypothetical protein